MISLFMNITRSGITVRYIISTVLQSGMSQIICPNSLKGYIMLGFWTSAKSISDGLTLVLDLGNIHVVFTMENVAHLMTKWYCAIIVMECTVSNASHHHWRKYPQKHGTVLNVVQN